MLCHTVPARNNRLKRNRMKKSSLLLFSAIMIFTFPSYSQEGKSVVKFVKPTSVYTPRGYSQAVKVDLGNATMLILSGQVPLDKQGNLVGKGDFAKQVEQTFLNIKSIVEDAGGTMNDVVKLNIYFIDITQIPTFREVRDKFISTKNPPTSTAAQVNRLFRDDVLIEVEATAIIRK